MKSIEVRYNEALEALGKVGKRQKFDEKRQAAIADLPTGKKLSIEVQLNLAEKMLKESHVIRNDGGELFVESVSDGYSREVTDLRELQVNSYISMGLSEADARKVLGLDPKEIAALGPNARAEYSFARSIGLSESKAIELAQNKGR
jgi:hypothetical protein